MECMEFLVFVVVEGGVVGVVDYLLCDVVFNIYINW